MNTINNANNANITPAILRMAVYAAYAASGKESSLFYSADAVKQAENLARYCGADFDVNVAILADALAAVADRLILPRDNVAECLALLRQDPATARAKARTIGLPAKALDKAMLQYIAELRA